MNKPNKIYRNAKTLLKYLADEAKRTTGQSDKPLIREVINQAADDIIKQFNFYAMKETISEKQATQFANWISAYAADLHPKN